MAFSTRAVRRPLRAGTNVRCPGCDELLQFRARVTTRPHQIVVNVYDGDRWTRLEQYHPHCYAELGEPHGPLTDPPEGTRNL